MLQEDMPDSMPNSVSDRLLDTLPDRMPENMPDRMPEDMGVDLNSFIRDPSFLPKKITFAKLSPSCVLSFTEVRCIYVCHVCCVLFTSMASSLLANTK